MLKKTIFDLFSTRYLLKVVFGRFITVKKNLFEVSLKELLPLEQGILQFIYLTTNSIIWPQNLRSSDGKKNQIKQLLKNALL